MAPVWGKMMDSIASGSWENYHMTSEHMCITNLFLNDFIKMINFLQNYFWLNDNSGCLDGE
jgi:hypothetical protein